MSIENFLRNFTLKEYENRCSFAEVMAKKQSGCFLEHGVESVQRFFYWKTT